MGHGELESKVLHSLKEQRGMIQEKLLVIQRKVKSQNKHFCFLNC